MSKACPKCGCQTLASHSFPSVPIGKITDGALAKYRAGRVSDLLSEVIAWSSLWVANQVRPPHECTHCNWVF